MRRRDLLRHEFGFGGRRRSRGVSHGDIFKDEFGLHGWTVKHVAALLLLLGVLAGAFFIKFGGDAQKLTSQLRSEFGDNRQVPVTLLGTDGRTITVRVQGTRDRAVLLGLARPRNRCESSLLSETVRRELPHGKRLVLVYDGLAGERTAGGVARVYATRGGQNLNVTIVRRGAARADLKGLGRSHQASRFRAAQQHAKARKLGLWAAC